MIALLRVASFITTDRGRFDRRLRLYRPSPKLIAHVQDWYTQTFACVDMLLPGHNLSQRVSTDTNFLGRFMASLGGPYYNESIVIGEYYPDLFQLLLMDSGFPVAASLVEAKLRGEPFPTVSAIAKRFGASQSQVRCVIRQAAEQGLVELGPQSRVESCDALENRIKLFTARELAFYIRYCLDLEADLRAAVSQSDDEPSRRHRLA